jgi:hypothetical protein
VCDHKATDDKKDLHSASAIGADHANPARKNFAQRDFQDSVMKQMMKQHPKACNSTQAIDESISLIAGYLRLLHQ